MSEWTLFSNHGHVLVCLANNQQARLRDVAAEVGITERAVQNILRELQGAGMVQISKQGRCNHYQINTRKFLRHPLEAHCTVGKLLQLVKTGEAEFNNPEVVVERPTKANKPQSDKPPSEKPKVDKPQPEAKPKTLASAPLPAEQVAKKPAVVEATKSVAEEIKPATKSGKDEKKSKPASDQQGSLF